MIGRRLLIPWLPVLVGLARVGAVAADPGNRVLLVYDGGREFSSIQIMDRSIEATLNEDSSTRAMLFREYMDITRIRAPHYGEALRDFYRLKYSEDRPDAIVAVRGRALDFLLNDGDPLFPDVPIVSSGMDARQIKARSLPPNVTGASLQVRYWPTLALARTLDPRTERAVVVIGASPNDRALEALVREELREHEEELPQSFLVGLPLDELLRRLAALPERTIVLFVSFAQDGNGRSFMPDDALRRVARAASVPTYIASDDVLDCGAVGGDLISFAALGRDTAGIASRILRGERPSSIPFSEASARVKTVDARQLERWGIPLARVPQGTVLLHRVPTMWEAYRWRIVAGASLIAFQSASILILLVNRKRRRRAEENLRVSEANRRVAVTEERNRMARDMHDTLAQGFTGVIVQLEAARQAFAHGSPADTEAHIHRASGLARHSLGEARRSIRALRPQALETGDLRIALAEAMQQATAGTGLQGRFATSGPPRALGAMVEENLLRIQQELLTNALKHSAAKAVSVTLSYEAEAVRLEVHDNGNGFKMSLEHDGLGLLGIRERVRQMEGSVTVDSRIGGGTRVCVVLPSEGGRASTADGR
jgi:signal transduction histidine kinase